MCIGRLAAVTEQTFSLSHTQGFWPKLKTLDGCYCWRQRSSARRLSVHAWGAAIDINAEENPLGDPSKQDLDVVRIFEEHG